MQILSLISDSMASLLAGYISTLRVEGIFDPVNEAANNQNMTSHDSHSKYKLPKNP